MTPAQYRAIERRRRELELDELCQDLDRTQPHQADEDDLPWDQGEDRARTATALSVQLWVSRGGC